jgi:DNA-binding response OmpR family regulator
MNSSGQETEKEASMVPSASPSAESFPTKEMNMQSHAKGVLVIEDNPGLADLLVIILKFGGYAVSIVTNAEAALTWIDHAICAGTVPAIVLLDFDTRLRMERSLFLNLLHERWQKIANTHPPLIILKTLVNDLDNIEYLVLQKPFHVQELLAMCKEVEGE